MSATGYTYKIVNNTEGFTFERFVWGCARAMGVLVHMRDEPSDAKIDLSGSRGTSDSYYMDSLKKEMIRYSEVEKMTKEQWDAQEADLIVARKKDREDYNDKCRSIILRLNSFRGQVDGWEPPSDEHLGFKRFMLEQLDSTIQGNTPMTPSEDTPTPYDERLDNIKRNINMYQEGVDKGAKRDGEVGMWLNALNESIPLPEDMKA